MLTPIRPSAGTLLARMTCGAEKRFELTPEQLSDLARNGQLKFSCPNCGTVTSWYGLELDRRTGHERRDSRHARIGMPIHLAGAKAFAAFLRPLFRQDWVVYSKPPFGSPQ